MINIKGLSIAQDGGLKRVAITFDEIDEVTGKIIRGNTKLNRVLTSAETLSAVDALYEAAATIISEELS